MISKISLGAVQFGMDYGIANKDGKPSFKIAKNIIKKAKTIGISKIDTAQAYGDSESILGNIGVKEFNITTKRKPTYQEQPYAANNKVFKL